jgi:membrane-bound inhibitor of C-type lysozyme
MRRQTFIALFGAIGVLIGQPPVFGQSIATYHCRDGSEFVLALYEYDRRAHVQLDGKAVALSKRVSLSGTRYAKGDITLRIMKTGATLKRGKRLTECTAG